ncbi:MAG: c-type cytochrome [Verrucomicrobiales bacterium]
MTVAILCASAPLRETLSAFSLCILFAFPAAALAQLGNKPGHVMPPPPAEWNDIPAPIVLPEHALATFEVDERFRVELIASEPLVEDPVAIAYDADGRAWVAEMRGFMPDIHGTGEEDPVGKIAILEDTNGDGTYDDRTVFLDHLVLPRALTHVEGGLLYADHTTLYFVAIENGRAGQPEIVDPEYAPRGAIEHKPNGLVRALDNWIYNAKSKFRYRRIDGAWVKEETEFRGQWGIAQDDYGRLLTNTNSNLANMELLPPGATLRNPGHSFSARTGATTPRNDVFPIRVTCGVNRGYMEGMLSPEGRLTMATAACGPAVYRGDNFPREFYGNLFVSEPGGLLVKRILAREEGYRISLAFAYSEREFFASTDERSRIVNAYSAPDGTLHLVDFYRGILQHKLYISTYLYDQILHRGLDKHIGRGRIYRVVSKEKPPGPPPRLSTKSSLELVPLLAHPNGWWRDTAQRLIVERGDPDALPALRTLGAESDNSLARIHALWCLEGLAELTVEDLAAAASSCRDPHLLAQVVRLAEHFGGSDANDRALEVLQSVAATRESLVDLHLALVLGRFEGDEALALLSTTLAHDPGDRFLVEAALSGLAGREIELLALNAEAKTPLQEALIDALSHDRQRFEAALALLPENLRVDYARNFADRKKPRESMIVSAADKRQYALGRAEYEKICFACHQQNGKGQQFLAPPLADSEWVQGDTGVLIAILLDGMTGPITVNGKNYVPPDIQPLMPGLRHNPEMSDEKIAAILTYVRNSWGNAAQPVTAATVAEARANIAEPSAPYTEAELEGL